MQAPLPLPEEPADSDVHGDATAEPAEHGSDMSQGEPGVDPFSVEPLQSPAKGSAGNWEPYKKPKNVRSLDLDTICMSQAKKPRAAKMESEASQ